jgi:hypothetical protein
VRSSRSLFRVIQTFPSAKNLEFEKAAPAHAQLARLREQAFAAVARNSNVVPLTGPAR